MSKKRPPLNDINLTPGLVGIGPIPGQAPVASFNLDQIDSLIETKGFIAYHYKYALPFDKQTESSPTNLNTQSSIRGYVYYNPRPLRIVPYRFTLEERLMAQGIFNEGSVVINCSSHYAEKDESKMPGKDIDIVHFSQRDLLVLPSLTDLTREIFEYNPNGAQRLKYKARGVDYLCDEDREYVCGRDFDINEKGEIYWLDGGLRPKFSSSGSSVLSCVYYYTPIYVVVSKLHSLRVLPSNSIGHGALPREARYAPQQLVCKPSNLIEEDDLTDWHALPKYPDYPDSSNNTGGSL